MAKMTGSEIFFLLWQLGSVLFNKVEPEIKTTLPVTNIPFIPKDYHVIVDLRPEPVDPDPIILVEPDIPPIPTLKDPIPIVTTPPISATVPTLRTII